MRSFSPYFTPPSLFSVPSPPLPILQIPKKLTPLLPDAKSPPNAPSEVSGIRNATSQSWTDKLTREHRMTLDEARLILNVPKGEGKEGVLKVCFDFDFDFFKFILEVFVIGLTSFMSLPSFLCGACWDTAHTPIVASPHCILRRSFIDFIFRRES
jgi:hypothetical protein